MSGSVCQIQIITSHSAPVNGKERSSAALMMLKIAVLLGDLATSQPLEKSPPLVLAIIPLGSIEDGLLRRASAQSI
ncbi:MAG TPA: hypothetical protein VE715_15715 [Blastocatellia bacterium]|nr:hypothetical protein [Blastocatellia bacterium]